MIVLPGEYSGARGDLGPEELVQITGESSIHGEAGSPVPVIVSDRPGWVLTVASNESIASDLEIIAPNSTAPLIVSQSTQGSYIYGPGGLPIEQISPEETPTYLHHDQLGSTRILTDNSGEAIATFTYGAYGDLKASTGSKTTSLGYAGQYTLPQSGLQYLRARVYDPQTSQFLSRDPLEALTRQPYAYAFDDPLNMSDPSGENPAAAAAAGAGAVCGATVAAPGVNAGTCGAAAGLAAAAGAAAAAAAISASLEDDEIAGNLTISKALAAQLAKANQPPESDADEDCNGKELKREGEELLGRSHSDAGRQRWQEWWEGLSPREKDAYRKVRGPRPRSRN